jgi:hypothetical protein
VIDGVYLSGLSELGVVDSANSRRNVRIVFGISYEIKNVDGNKRAGRIRRSSRLGFDKVK